MPLKGKLMAMAYMPVDAALLAAVGRVTIRHGFLDWTLNRTIKSLTWMSPEQADFILATEGSASLRRKIMHIAAAKFGKKSETYKALKKLIDRCESATNERNRLTHNIWVTVEGNAVLLDLQRRDKKPAPLPTAAVLDALAERIHALSAELNSVRSKDGFLATALRSHREAERAARSVAD